MFNSSDFQETFSHFIDYLYKHYSETKLIQYIHY